MNIELFERELTRIEDTLSLLEIGSEQYDRALQNYERILWAVEKEKEREAFREQQLAPACTKQPEQLPGQMTVEELEPKQETPPWEEQSPYPETTEPQELTREYVRAKLEQASGRGVVIQPIIARFVPEGKPVKFSQIPESSWPQLLEVLGNAG